MSESARPAAESVDMSDEARAAYLQGYEFALRNFHDEAVQADYRRLRSQVDEAGSRAKRSIRKFLERYAR